MAIWRMDQIKAPPQTDDPAQLRQYIKYLSNQIASMLKDLDYVLNGQVDFRNVRAKSIKADNLNVDELSAITANMGKITSGEIYGAYIATREAAYPRAEMSNTDDLFATYFDANNYIKYVANYASAPAVEFWTGGSLRARFSTIFGDLELYAPNGLTLSAPRMQFQNWTVIYNSDENKTLQDELDEIYDRLEALEGP